MSRRRKTLIALGIMLGVAILVPVIRHYQLRAATEAYIAQLKAQGEPMELPQVIPPPVPPDQNGADTFRRAAALIDADTHLGYTNYAYGMGMIAAGKAMVRWWQPDIRDSDGTNSWESVEAAVDQNTQSFALLQQIIARPDFDFHIKYEKGVTDLDFTNLYLPESKRAAQWLETAAICGLRRGDTASAVENLHAMLALSKALRDERLVISELVRIAIANIALTVNWEVLQSTNVTDGQLAELQNDWMGLDFVRGEENALEMERLMGCMNADKWRNCGLELQHFLEPDVSAPGFFDQGATALRRVNIATKVLLWRYWWSYPDELQMLKGYQLSLAATHSAETNGSFLKPIEDQKKELEILRIGAFGSGWEVMFGQDMDMHRMLSASVTPLSFVLNRVMMAETTKQVVVAATALKRYQLKHGTYPPDLNSLVPEFLPKVPLDPVDGCPLRYRRNADGTFLLYSVGENGQDDGGNPALEKNFKSSIYYWQIPHALDWVWPQPASPAEIQNYYAHPPK
jgi:hypothetical protein